MEKKKLKKLSINKMDGFPVIGELEQMTMKGGVIPWWKIIKYVFKGTPAGPGSDNPPDTRYFEEHRELYDQRIEEAKSFYGDFNTEDFYQYAVSDNA